MTVGGMGFIPERLLMMMMMKTGGAVQSRGPGNTHREGTYLSWAAPPYAYACGCVLAYADKRLPIFNTYTHPTDQPMAHLRG